MKTKPSGVTVVLYTLWTITAHTHTEKFYLFISYNKNSNGLLKDLGGMKKEKQVRWRDMACVCPLIDNGQQPMKMHTEVTLLYK